MYYEEINVYIYYVDLVGIFVWIINFNLINLLMLLYCINFKGWLIKKKIYLYKYIFNKFWNLVNVIRLINYVLCKLLYCELS